jgi:hypothetical protein
MLYLPDVSTGITVAARSLLTRLGHAEQTIKASYWMDGDGLGSASSHTNFGQAFDALFKCQDLVIHFTRLAFPLKYNSWQLLLPFNEDA